MQYQPPQGPVVAAGVIALGGGLTAMHYTLLAVTIVFTAFIASRILRRGIRKASK